MDTEARREHFEVKTDDWIYHAYIPIEEADKKVGSELKNDIHSMFSQELDERPRDATTKARWAKTKPEDYELLRPALRLATQLLESRPSSDAICSIVHGDRHPSPEKIVHLGVSIAEFHKHNLLPSDVRGTAGKVLKRLGKTIRFRVTDLDRRPDDDHTAFGRTIAFNSGFPQGATTVCSLLVPQLGQSAVWANSAHREIGHPQGWSGAEQSAVVLFKSRACKQ